MHVKEKWRERDSKGRWQMERIEVDWPDPVVFTTELDIRITDINYGGHLGNDRLLSLVHEARVRFLVSHGWSELDVDGVGVIMTDAAMQFRSEIFYGSKVCIDLGIAIQRRVRFTLLYGLRDVETGDELARVRTGMAFFDYAARRAVRAPRAFTEVISA
jgi:acyl-CoA thioesterase FadM